MSRLVVLLIVVALLLPRTVTAQGGATADVWRDFAKQIAVGSELRVRLSNGQKFNATLVSATDEAMLLQPKTRQPVGVQRVPYGDVESLERRKDGGGGVGKAVAIGAAVGAGALLGLLAFIAVAMD